MYFPYLYARQSELLALTSMISNHRMTSSLVPVVEPVLNDTSRISRFLTSYGERRQSLCIVLNPDKHELQSSHAVNSWRSVILPIIDAQQSLIPTLRCFPGVTFQEIQEFLTRFPNRSVAIAYSSPTLSDVEISSLASLPNIIYHIILDRRISAHTFNLLPRAKIVDLVDNFNKLERNADYRDPEFFTDQHTTFRANNFVGFGDYCCIGSDLSVTGGPAAAVAIHAVFKSLNNDIWVEHFVSDDIDRAVGDTAGKFLQAAEKLVHASQRRPHEFGRNFALNAYSNYVSSRHFPNLAKSKELQINHHICLMLDALNGLI